MGRGLRIIGASVAGPKRAAGQPGEDAHAWATCGDLLVVAVADGAGSASLAATGSTLAAGFAVEHTAWLLHEVGEPSLELLADAVAATRRALVRRARSLGVPLADLSTTLALAVAGPSGTWVAQVGDGIVAAGGDDLRLLASNEEGEYLNETTFLTSRRWRSSLVCEEVPGPRSALALSTDGLALLAVDRESARPHSAFFTPLFDHCRRGSEKATEDLVRFLGSPRVAERTDDDVTLVLATFD